ncbi:hypothetical protein AB1Y20_019689 [Prymnesium parvum]|uniref:Alpha-1,4-N-acetylglucosaminyltransferase n=1 Tax=Prymnesium parvum TaxID=97485 RepID=A0AB34JT14_PRYPA
MHRLWLVQIAPNSTPPRAARYESVWRQKNPALHVDYLRSRDAEELIRRHYPAFLRSYRSLQTGVERADFVRYLAIHRYGGVYADDDVVPIMPIGRWLPTFGWRTTPRNALVVGVERARPPLLAQFVFASVPRHPLLWAVAEEVHARVQRLTAAHRFSVLERTGPLAWTSAILRFIDSHAAPRDENRSVVDETQGRLIQLEKDGQQWSLLVLPYRAFGVNRAHQTQLRKEPSTQHLVHHQFLGSWKSNEYWHARQQLPSALSSPSPEGIR